MRLGVRRKNTSQGAGKELTFSHFDLRMSVDCLCGEVQQIMEVQLSCLKHVCAVVQEARFPPSGCLHKYQQSNYNSAVVITLGREKVKGREQGE